MKQNVDLLHELHNQNPNDPTFVTYFQKYRELFRTEVKKRKKTFNDNLIKNSTNVAKDSWKLINSKRLASSNNYSEKLTAEDFSTFFGDIPHNLENNLKLSNTDPIQLMHKNLTPVNSVFNFREITFNEVRDTIDSIKKKKSKDYYNISITIVRNIKNLILVPLTRLINRCINENLFPSCLKVTKVIPIHKKGNVDDVDKYRPISITPIFGKILEKIMLKQLEEYVTKQNILNQRQFGFQHGKSTTMAINRLVDEVITCFETKQFLGCTFCDLSKAFDSINHNILINKLELYGLSNGALQLIFSFLHNRQQVVLFNNVYSEMTIVNIGVPQGSILGPLLFLLYINDLAKHLDNKIILFADDTTCYSVDSDIPSLLDRMEQDINAASEWFTSNRLTLNVLKTQKMVFSLRYISEIDNPRCVKFLGVTLDPKLCWDNHVIDICKKLSKSTFLIRNLQYEVSEQILMMIYYSLFQSIFSYAIITWGHSSHLKTVFKLQRRVVRIIGGLSYRACVKNYFKEKSILTVPCLYILYALLYVKSNLTTYNNLTNMSLITRSTHSIYTEFYRVGRSRNAINYYGPKLFNKLPKRIANLPFSQFSRTIRNFLLKNAFYSLDEFLNCSDVLCSFYHSI